MEHTEENTPKRIRVALDFSQEALARLEDVQRLRKAATKAEVIRNALRTYEWLCEQSRLHRSIALHEHDGKQVAHIEAEWLLK